MHRVSVVCTIPSYRRRVDKCFLFLECQLFVLRENVHDVFLRVIVRDSLYDNCFRPYSFSPHFIWQSYSATGSILQCIHVLFQPIFSASF